MKLITKLLRRNLSGSRIAGFIISNFLGLLIVCCAVQFYSDASGLLEDKESFLRSDRVVINKRVAGGLADPSANRFSPSEIEELRAQSWVNEVGAFRAADFRIHAMLPQGERTLSTALFFESVPDRYLDVSSLPGWRYDPASGVIPIVIPKDYLALYNFGFAGSAGMPQLSEQLISGLPLAVVMQGAGGQKETHEARIVGFTTRMNTILVPDEFLRDANFRLGGQTTEVPPTRLVVEVGRPGDVAISQYLEAHDYEQAGEKGRNSASYLLRVVALTVGGVGLAITLMSLIILLLSVSLLMEKNRDRIHSLLMLGAPLDAVARPYLGIVWCCGGVSLGFAIVGTLLLRRIWLGPLSSLGIAGRGVWWMLGVGVILSLLVGILNGLAIRRRIRRAY